jgi:assimilatory nitrate reductase catalytic subunit
VSARTHKIQGPFSFEGKGTLYPVPLEPSALYAVPSGKRARLIYFCGGNATDQLVTITVTRDGAPIRFFPLGAKTSADVPLAVQEDAFSESQFELLATAPDGLVGVVVLDLGIVESEQTGCHEGAHEDGSVR